MTSESKALKSLFFGQVCLTVDLTPIPPGLGMRLGDIYIVHMWLITYQLVELIIQVLNFM